MTKTIKNWSRQEMLLNWHRFALKTAVNISILLLVVLMKSDDDVNY